MKSSTTKVIRDIRYYGGYQKESSDSRHPQTKDIYGFDKDLRLISKRIALKLKEIGVTLGQFHHLYIVFSPDLPFKKIKIHKYVDPYHKWMRWVFYGLPTTKFNSLPIDLRKSMIINATIECVKKNIRKNSPKKGLLDEARRELIEKGDEIEIILKRVHVNDREVILSHQIHPLGNNLSTTYLTYIDSKNTIKKKLFESNMYGEILELIRKIEIKKTKIVVHPSATTRHNKRLSNTIKFPISIEINSILEQDVSIEIKPEKSLIKQQLIKLSNKKYFS